MKTTLLLLSICMNSFLWSQTNECSNVFKTGTFVYEDLTLEAVIIRTKKKQKEFWNNGASYIVMKVKWLNDSHYVLTVQKIVNAPGCLEKGDKIWTKIESCEGNKVNLSFSTKSCGEGASSMIRKGN